MRSAAGESIKERTSIVQQKTGRPVQFDLTEQTRESIMAWIKQRGVCQGDYLFPSRIHTCPHITTRQYARILGHWEGDLIFGTNNGQIATLVERHTRYVLLAKVSG